jgi:hypothetical protein
MDVKNRLLMKYLVKMYQTSLIYFVMQLPLIIFKLFLTQIGFDRSHECNLENKAHDSAVHAEFSYTEYP